MDFFHLSAEQWLLAVLAALCVGISKAGFTGVGMLFVALMASVMRGHELESTGVILPLLICADVFAVRSFRGHVQWPILIRLLLPALVGIGAGFFWMREMSNAGFKVWIGWIVLGLVAFQLFRQARPGLFRQAPQGRAFSWTAGVGAGFTTMIANAAGPIMTLYLLAVRLPKLALVGTGAWYFFLVNLIKVPFSAKLGYITPASLLFNVALVPAVAVGFSVGRYCLHRLDQGPFERLLLLLTALAALHLIIF